MITDEQIAELRRLAESAAENSGAHQYLGVHNTAILALLAEREALRKALADIRAAELKSSPTATDFGVSWDRGLLIGRMKDIAREALQGEQA